MVRVKAIRPVVSASWQAYTLGFCHLRDGGMETLSFLMISLQRNGSQAFERCFRVVRGLSLIISPFLLNYIRKEGQRHITGIG